LPLFIEVPELSQESERLCMVCYGCQFCFSLRYVYCF